MRSEDTVKKTDFFETSDEDQQTLGLQVGDLVRNVELWQKLAQQFALVFCSNDDDAVVSSRTMREPLTRHGRPHSLSSS